MAAHHSLPLLAADIMEYLPHRPPMLLLDRVVEYTENTIVAEKTVTGDEFFFQGHFPGNPMMPGVMIVEAIAQAGALLAALNDLFDTNTELLAFAGMNDVKFRRPVTPNETLRVFAEIVKHRRNLYKFAGRVEVEGVLVTQLTFSAASSPRV
jgi:3-hydroxyacyl-[acyl-carrier-protein] dehydratase